MRAAEAENLVCIPGGNWIDEAMDDQAARLQVINAIISKVSDAVFGDRMLNTGQEAAELIARYPDCGMTSREIQDEITRQVGLARGAAEIERSSKSVD